MITNLVGLLRLVPVPREDEGKTNTDQHAKTVKELIAQQKKNIHVSIPRETYINLKILCYKHELSMQSLFIEFAERATSGDPYVEELVEELKERKRNNIIKGLTDTDVDHLYKILARDD